MSTEASVPLHAAMGKGLGAKNLLNVADREECGVCLVGCAEAQLDEAGRTPRIGETTFREGDLLTLDRNDGAVYSGEVHTAVQPLSELIARLERLRAARPG